MKRWALVVAGLYLLILATLTAPVILLAMAPTVHWRDAIEAYAAWPCWVWLAVMVVGQWTLLTVPVRIASRRSVTQRSLWPTLIVAGLMMGGLTTGVVVSLAEFIFRDHGIDYFANWIALGLPLLTWAIWSLVFRSMSKRSAPEDFISRQCRWLFRGSILELLVAVPTHIVARYRGYCCAGFLTFIGLTMGISVMLFSFGPAVFFLYVERWRRLHPKEQADDDKGAAGIV